MLKKVSFAPFFIACIILFASLPLRAEQKADLGPWEVHYIAFDSTFISADIAQQYGLDRGRAYSILNISVLDRNDPQKAAQQVEISGTTRNLIGNSKNLQFKQVKEGDAVYYLAMLRHHNEETFQFNIEIKQGQQQQTLKFNQTFYVQ